MVNVGICMGFYYDLPDISFYSKSEATCRSVTLSTHVPGDSCRV